MRHNDKTHFTLAFWDEHKRVIKYTIDAANYASANKKAALRVSHPSNEALARAANGPTVSPSLPDVQVQLLHNPK